MNQHGAYLVFPPPPYLSACNYHSSHPVVGRHEESQDASSSCLLPMHPPYSDYEYPQIDGLNRRREDCHKSVVVLTLGLTAQLEVSMLLDVLFSLPTP